MPSGLRKTVEFVFDVSRLLLWHIPILRSFFHYSTSYCKFTTFQGALFGTLDVYLTSMHLSSSRAKPTAGGSCQVTWQPRHCAGLILFLLQLQTLIRQPLLGDTTIIYFRLSQSPAPGRAGPVPPMQTAMRGWVKLRRWAVLPKMTPTDSTVILDSNSTSSRHAWQCLRTRCRCHRRINQPLHEPTQRTKGTGMDCPDSRRRASVFHVYSLETWMLKIHRDQLCLQGISPAGDIELARAPPPTLTGMRCRAQPGTDYQEFIVMNLDNNSNILWVHDDGFISFCPWIHVMIISHYY